MSLPNAPSKSATHPALPAGVQHIHYLRLTGKLQSSVSSAALGCIHASAIWRPDGLPASRGADWAPPAFPQKFHLEQRTDGHRPGGGMRGLHWTRRIICAQDWEELVVRFLRLQMGNAVSPKVLGFRV